MRLAATLYEIYDKQPYVDGIRDLLDGLEARQTDEGSPLGFRPMLNAAE